MSRRPSCGLGGSAAALGGCCVNARLSPRGPAVARTSAKHAATAAGHMNRMLAETSVAGAAVHGAVVMLDVLTRALVFGQPGGLGMCQAARVRVSCPKLGVQAQGSTVSSLWKMVSVPGQLSPWHSNAPSACTSRGPGQAGCGGRCPTAAAIMWTAANSASITEPGIPVGARGPSRLRRRAAPVTPYVWAAAAAASPRLWHSSNVPSLGRAPPSTGMCVSSRRDGNCQLLRVGTSLPLAEEAELFSSLNGRRHGSRRLLPDIPCSQ